MIRYFLTLSLFLSHYALAFDCQRELADAKNTHLFEFDDLSVKGILSGSYPETAEYRIQTAFKLKQLVDRACIKFEDFKMKESDFQKYLNDLAPAVEKFAKHDKMKKVIYGIGQADLTKIALIYLGKENSQIKSARDGMIDKSGEVEKLQKDFDKFSKGLSCKDTDLSKSMPPVRHQDGTGWCDAFVAADLLSQKTGKNISALDISLNYQKHLEAKNIILKDDINPTKVHGAHIALHKAMGHGYCLEKELPSEVGDGYGYNIADQLKQFSNLNKNTSLSNCLQLQYGNPFPEIPLGDFSRIIKENTDDRYFSLLRERSCQRSKEKIEDSMTVAFGSNTYDDDFASKKKIVQKAIEQLEKGVAVGFEHPFSLMYNSNYLESELPGTWHASSIVGMRKDDSGECRFKVRSTLGQRARFPGRHSKDGYFWISARELAANARLLFYIN